MFVKLTKFWLFRQNNNSITRNNSVSVNNSFRNSSTWIPNNDFHYLISKLTNYGVYGKCLIVKKIL